MPGYHASPANGTGHVSGTSLPKTILLTSPGLAKAFFGAVNPKQIAHREGK